jgi:hypothetical protein
MLDIDGPMPLKQICGRMLSKWRTMCTQAHPLSKRRGLHRRWNVLQVSTCALRSHHFTLLDVQYMCLTQLSRQGNLCLSGRKRPEWVSIWDRLLSLTTGLVSPQYHVVFDDHFQTVRNNRPGSLFYKSEWQALAGFELDLDEPKVKKSKRGGRAARMVTQLLHPTFPGRGQVMTSPDDDMQASDGEEDVLPPEGGEEDEPPPGAPIEPDPDPEGRDVLDEGRQGQAHGPRARQSGRTRSRPAWWEPYYVANEALLSSEYWDPEQYAIDHGTIYPIFFAASNDPDVMFYDQAMKQPDADKFEQACVDEIAAHHDNGHWEVVPRSSLAAGTRVVPSVWSMKRKR